jgi:hypothetical protein
LARIDGGPQPAFNLPPAAGFDESHLNEADQKRPSFLHLSDQEVSAFRRAGVKRIVSAAYRVSAILAPAAYDAWLLGGGNA